MGPADNWDSATLTNQVDNFLQGNYDIPSSEATVVPDQNNQTVKVSLTENNPFHLAPVIGMSSALITRSGTARLGDGQSAFNYAIFSDNSLSLTTAAYVTGGVHSNNEVFIGGLSGSSGSFFTGGIESIGGIYYNKYLLPPYPSWMNTGPTGTIYAAKTGSMIDNAPYISMPDLSSLIKAQASAESHYITPSNWTQYLNSQYNGYYAWNYSASNNTFSPSGSDVVLGDGTWYFDGNVDLTTPGGWGTDLKGALFATGTIKLGGGGLNANSEGNPVGIYSASSSSDAIDMGISSSAQNYLNGILYAPNGGIKLGGGIPIVNGQVIGKTVTTTNSITVNYDNYASILSLSEKAYLSQ